MDLDADACYRAFRTKDSRFDGRLFCGVTSTGIYCRPICPARTPKREHLVFFPTAAAAQEAGFRPCLRCRPETAPNLAAWRGTSNTVGRALVMIEAGALDDSRVGDLAERLGVGERQLRRLFQAHLGASPLAVAQTRRVFLALQLLQETELSLTDVALASGFGSIRRFNEVFQRLFRRPPRALRRAGPRAVAAADCDIEILLRYRPPYDWPAMLRFLEARAIRGIETVDAGRYARTIDLDGVHGVVVVGPASGHALGATIRCPRISALPAIIARLRRVFDLAADPLAIGAQLAEDRLLEPLIRTRPGLRVPGAWDEFELMVRAVLGQQITVKAASGLAARLVGAYGTPLSLRHAPIDGLTHVFPRPECLADADVERLVMPRSRARTLIALAAAVAAEPHMFDAGRHPAEVLDRLRAIPGIGEWTAQYIAMRALRDPDAFPAGDIGLQRALAGSDDRRPSARELMRRAERWRPWRAYAAQHLWASSG